VIATLEEERLYVDEYFIFGNKQEGPVPLTVRGHAKGYFAFSVNSLNFFNHNGYKNYYLTQEINGQKFLRNRFFRYENNQPYLLSKNKKVFIFTETDGSIPYSEENSRYYFQVSRIIELKKAEEPKKNKEV